MNGFTWSAKGDLVPVCCHNAVGNTSPCSAKPRRSLYYSTRESAEWEKERERERERERGSSAVKLPRLDAALLFILPNDHDKLTIKVHAGRIATPTGRTLVRQRSCRIHRGPNATSVAAIRRQSLSHRTITTMQVHRTLTFANPPTDRITIREMLLIHPETSCIIDLNSLDRKKRYKENEFCV